MDNTTSSFTDYLFKNRLNIFKYLVLSLFISIFYSFYAKVLFKSEITLYPAGELSSSNEIYSDFKDAIESFGFESSNSDNNFYIPDIIESRRLKKEILYRKWNSKKFSYPVNLIEYWELDDLNILNRFLLYFKTFFNSFEYNSKLKFEEDAIKLLDELIDVDEKNSGLIEVTVLMDEPQLAADIANFISKYVILYVGNEQKHFATKTKLFLKTMLDSSKIDLKESEIELTNFKKKNPLSLDTPDLQLKRLRLTRNVEVNQEVYITIRKQYELSKIEESKERLFVNILDNAKPSLYKEYPNRLIIIISFTFLGTLFLILCQRIYFELKSIKRKFLI